MVPDLQVATIVTTADLNSLWLVAGDFCGEGRSNQCDLCLDNTQTTFAIVCHVGLHVFIPKGAAVSVTSVEQFGAVLEQQLQAAGAQVAVAVY